MLKYTTYRDQSGFSCHPISRDVTLDEALSMLFEVSLMWGGGEAASAEDTFAVVSRALNCFDRCEYTGEGAEIMRQVCRTFLAIKRCDQRLGGKLTLDATFCALAFHLPAKLAYVASLGRHVYHSDIDKIARAIDLVKTSQLSTEHITAAFTLALEGFDFVEALEIALMRPRYKYDDLLPVA